MLRQDGNVATSRWNKRGADPAELQALHPGVPSWIRRRVIAWAQVVSSQPRNSSMSSFVPDTQLLEDYETAIRRPTTLVHVFRQGGVAALFEVMEEEEFVDFLDFLVFRNAEGDVYDDANDLLEAVLSDGGSEWRVGTRDGFASLEKRVPEGVTLAVERTITSAGTAGDLLAEAWHAVFGRSPDPEEAYEKAIKAVEEAGHDKVSPKNGRTSLGTMVRDMKAQGDWRLDLPASDADVPVKMAEALWVGQESRHGGNGYRKPTQLEAEAAVSLAVPLVQWFSSGALARRP